MRMSIQIAVVILLGLVIYGCSAKPSGPPKPVFDAEDFDFGRIPENSTVTHIYQLTNEGGDSVVIQRVRTHCGCTKAPVEKTVAGPGETIPIELRFNSRGIRGSSKKSATVNLFIEEENTPNFRLMFSTFTDTTSNPFGYGELGAEPYQIEFSDSVEYVDIKLTNRMAAKREIRVVDYQPDRIKVSWENKNIGPKEETTLRVTRIVEPRSIVASVTLEMAEHPNTRITIPISEYIAPGTVRTGKSVSRKVVPPDYPSPWGEDK